MTTITKELNGMKFTISYNPKSLTTAQLDRILAFVHAHATAKP